MYLQSGWFGSASGGMRPDFTTLNGGAKPSLPCQTPSLRKVNLGGAWAAINPLAIQLLYAVVHRRRL